MSYYINIFSIVSAHLATLSSGLFCQAKDERNYHIFYEMLAGLPSQQRQAFYLQEAETYYYLNQVGGDTASSSAVFSGDEGKKSEFPVCGCAS